MQLSRYIKQFKHIDNPDYTLLCSTKNGAIILLHKSVLSKITNSRPLRKPVQKTLVELGFLVPNLAEEKKEVLTYYDRLNKSKDLFEAVVILNLDCNLDCAYCYEGDLKGRRYMTKKTADLLIKFMKTHYLGHTGNIYLSFYGGEPLLSLELIKYISGKLWALTSKYAFEYSFGLVTNGALLTKKRVEELLPLGLATASVTLDGPPENHNKFRPFANGKGSFGVIMRNLKNVCNLLKLQINGNFTRDNYRDFPALLDHFIAEGLTPEKLAGVKFGPVAGSPYNRSEFMSDCSAQSEDWISGASLFLREEIMKRGFLTQKLRPAGCMVNLDHSIVVNHDGNILKCPAFIGYPGLNAGNIKTGIKDYSPSHRLNLWKKEECLNCEYLPICYGGCRYYKLMKEGKIDSVHCKKPDYDATLETLVKQDLRYSQKIGQQ